MSDSIKFTLDGKEVEAGPDETIWQVANRHGTEIPHLCYRPEPGYRPDGNCRACMVEIEGERVLAASCLRKPADGMVVKSASDRAKASRKMVMELLMADQPARAEAHDGEAAFWNWADRMEVTSSRFPERDMPEPDASHPAMSVNLDACINCNLCVRACREVQVNDVIGMAMRGHNAKIVFDFDDPMGDSTCVACGECVQACPTGALMPASIVDENGVGARTADRDVHSVCPFCGVGCQLTYKVRDDKIAWVEGRSGPANENRLCVKGRFGFDYAHHPDRLTVPMIRREDAPKNADDYVDPANPWTHFREATWDEALDLAASGLMKTKAEHGPSALAGFGSAKGTNEEAYLFQKLVRTGFGTNNVDHCTRLCHASSVAALMEGIGSGAVTAPVSECRNAEVIIVIGAQPTTNHPVAATYIKNAVKKGATLIVMDPRGQGLDRYATHKLQFKPGTDVAMLNAIMNVIVNEKLYDQNYIDGFTSDFRHIRDHVDGFSPEEMAGICGIDADMLRTVARTYAGAKSAMIFWGMGISQHVHGTDNARCLIAMALMTGQVGRPGTGLHPLRGQNNVQGASDSGLIPMVYPNYAPVDDPATQAFFEQFWDAKLDPNRGLTVVEIMDAAHRGDIRAMYVMGENPAMSDPDQLHVREALARLDHLVVQEIFLTETAMFADVILPASVWPEKDGTVSNTDRRVQMGRPAVPLPGQARQDWEIIRDLANRMGLNWSYSHARDVFAELRDCMPPLKGITWERLENEGAVTYPCEAEDQPGKEVIFGDGYPTADGRGKFVPADIVPPDEEPDDDYPMVLTTGRLLEHWHTGAMTRRATNLDALEPEGVAHLSPKDLGRMGVEPGGWVSVSTRRGSVSLRARVDRGVPEGVVFIPFCFAESPANRLTNPALDPAGKIAELKYCAARVEPGEREAAE
jgi:formate dehydrogenase major subunit